MSRVKEIEKQIAELQDELEVAKKEERNRILFLNDQYKVTKDKTLITIENVITSSELMVIPNSDAFKLAHWLIDKPFADTATTIGIGKYIGHSGFFWDNDVTDGGCGTLSRISSSGMFGDEMLSYWKHFAPLTDDFINHIKRNSYEVKK